MTRRIVAAIVSLFLFQMFALCGEPRKEVYVEGGQFHVQGIAYDSEKDLMYMSFTSAFFVTDMEGTIIASVTGINGHLGAMTFDPESRMVYASLEMKDDEIGRNISSGLGAQAHTREGSRFFVAAIDVDALKALDTPADEVMTLLLVDEACADYKAEVEVDGKSLEHRFACSGIDGVTIGPGFGAKTSGCTLRSAGRFLYVAYGVYGDVNRQDNDYNVILAYPLKRVERAVRRVGRLSPERRGGKSLPKVSGKYFIRTGNTTWGVQNMAYDASSGKLFLAVYKGRKAEWPNYTLFSVDMDSKPFSAALEGVPYAAAPVQQLSVSQGCYFKWGSTGLCPLGDGLFYISENGKTSAGSNYCRARLYRFTADGKRPFERL